MKQKRGKITPRFTEEQRRIIHSLVPSLAGSPSEVVSRIVMMWLMEKRLLELKKGEVDN